MTTATAVKERPILFSGRMVRAILEGHKTQTRRVVKFMSREDPTHFVLCDNGLWQAASHDDGSDFPVGPAFPCPYGKPGDQLWVRETWQQYQEGPGGQRATIDVPCRNVGNLCYAADFDEDPPRWRPSIHMPRWASRIQLEVTGVRVERVQDITYGDCKEEGVDMSDVVYEPDWDFRSFQTLWDSINADRGYGWESNPWVWVVKFKQVENT